MGAMRMSDFYLSEVLRLSEWVIKNTNSNHSQNLRAKRLTKRVMKFINRQSPRSPNLCTPKKEWALIS